MSDINPYDYHIAKAAREYIEELNEYYYDYKPTYDKLLKLRWLILAEKNSWNPNIYDEITAENSLQQEHELELKRRNK